MTHITKLTERKAISRTQIMAMVLAGFVVVVLQSSSVHAQWTTTGTNISNTNTGNVGVGTTTSTPNERLSVLVQDAVSNGVTQVLSISHSTTGTPSAGLGPGLTFRANRSDGSLGSTGYIAGIWEDPTNGTEDGVLVFAPALNSAGFGTERMRITSIGNVGIGTTSPTKKLHLFGSNSQVLVDRSANTAGNYALVNFATNGVQKFFFGMNADSDPNIDKLSLFDAAFSATVPVMTFTGGKIGIGTSTPNSSYKLDVNGNTNVTGNLNATGTITGGTIQAKYQDVAEWVQSSQELAAGTVVVLDQTKSNQVIASMQAYDTRVAGVISSQSGITLGENGAGKVLVATTGRVKIKVDVSRGSIQVGDLLVTSDVPGVAMKSQPIDVGGVQIHRPGTLIGKALEPLAKGAGEILVLLSLQ